MEVFGSVGQSDLIPKADSGRFIILRSSDGDNNITYILCDLVVAPLFLRMAKRPVSEG